MSLSDLASIGSLVSGVAVLVSLIYLSQQTRQNTKHSRALIQQGRSLGSQDYLVQQALDPSLQKSWYAAMKATHLSIACKAPATCTCKLRFRSSSRTCSISIATA